ncbi:hypothetical protein [Roseiarcus sp.]|uniref:hypothetical protein n=1 Tax=Roseiarcus sp. TaxID=1969460 RepID=UPI003F9449DA
MRHVAKLQGAPDLLGDRFDRGLGLGVLDRETLGGLLVPKIAADLHQLGIDSRNFAAAPAFCGPLAALWRASRLPRLAGIESVPR